MDLHEALEEVLYAVKQPKQSPPGMTPVPLSGDALDTKDLKARVWHESLTPAQETVCRWVWETCAQHNEPWEQFEVGFLYDYNISHELAVWVRIALVFAEFHAEIPAFVAEIKKIFERWQLAQYLETARETAPFEPSLFEPRSSNRERIERQNTL